MIYLNKSLHIKGDPQRENVSYFNGDKKEINTDNFTAFWELLKIISEGVSSLEDEKIHLWQEKFSINSQETSEIFEFIEQENFLSSVNADLDQSFQSRNKRYYSMYGKPNDNFINTLEEQTILIIGVGTIGATLAQTLSKLGVGKLILVDDDVVELKNITAQHPFDYDDVGSLKVSALKDKIQRGNSSVDIVTIENSVNNEYLSQLPLLLNEHDVNFAISCFDTGNLNLHINLFEIFREKQVSYILTGYSSDSTIATLLDMVNGKDELIENYGYHPPEYFLGINHGNIIHSNAASLLVSNLILHKLGLFDNPQKTSLEYRFSTLSETQVESIGSRLSKEKFIDSLSIIQDFLSLEHTLKSLEEKVYAQDGEYSEQLESEILSLHQFFSILELCGFEINQDYLHKFFEIFNYLDDNVIDKNESSNEFTEEEFHKVVDKLEVDGQRIYKALITINKELDYNKKKYIQSSIYNEISKNSDYLIECLFHNKKKYINSDYENEVMAEINGFNSDEVDIFQKKLVEKYEEFQLKIFDIMFDDNSNPYNYLYDLGGNKNLSLSFEEVIDLQKELYIRNYSNNKFGRRFISHINKMVNNNYITHLPDSEIYKTFYFPQVKESRIIIDYFDSMVPAQNLIHEIGHSYYNEFYKDDFFNKSQVILNETLAILHEVIFYTTLLKDGQVEDTIKNTYAYHYIQRINKLLVSPFSVFVLENNIINHVRNHSQLDFDTLIDIRKRTKDSLTPNLKLENEENSYLNILINSTFVLEYKDGISECMSTALAISIYEKYKDNLELLDTHIEQMLANGEKNLNSLCKSLLNKSYDESLVELIIDSMFSHVNFVENYFYSTKEITNQ
ncbi:HesA/MoeB/ThiF family protein [Guptibacillus sedimenti]|uniref:HesA/MoeB/ThiF family protein n=1 Tax=Guptibacillus sedimenti TaxID=3025680 RepID=UPI002362678E|nr:ThiF family adenylyltransferase [Pseudalkalibacillus sedimenti]